MRTSVTLALYVFSFLPLLFGGDWAGIQKSAVQAVNEGNLAGASGLFLQAQALAQTPMERAFSEVSLGTSFYRVNRNKEAAVWLDRAIVDFEKCPEASEYLRIATATLAEVLRMQGNYESSERMLRDGIAKAASHSAGRGVLLTGLADLLREQGSITESRALFSEALAEPDMEWQRRADALTGLAELSQLERAFEDSFNQWKEAGDLAKLHSSADLEVTVLRGAGETWLQTGNTVQAEPLLQKSVWAARAHAKEHPAQVAASLMSLARLYMFTDRLAMSIDALREAIDIEETLLDPGHPQLAIMYETLAESLSRRGDSEAARSYVDRARGIFEAHFGETSPASARLMAVAAEIEMRDHKPVAAATRYEQAMKMSRSLGAVGAALGRSIVGPYAALLKASHRGPEAKALLAEAKTVAHAVK